jgi:hypothetical protein
VAIVAALVLAASCGGAQEGKSCHEGDYSTHTNRRGDRTSYECIDGRWRKV